MENDLHVHGSNRIFDLHFVVFFDPNVATINEHEETQRNSERELKRSSCLNVSYLRNKEYLVYLVASSAVFLGIAIPIVHLVGCKL